MSPQGYNLNGVEDRRGNSGLCFINVYLEHVCLECYRRHVALVAAHKRCWAAGPFACGDAVWTLGSYDSFCS